MSALYWNGSTRGNAAFWIPATVRSTCSHGTDSGGMMRDEEVGQSVLVERTRECGVAGDERDQLREIDVEEFVDDVTQGQVGDRSRDGGLVAGCAGRDDLGAVEDRVGAGERSIGKARIGNARMGELRMSNARMGNARIGRDCSELAVLKNVPSGDAVRSRSSSDSPARARLARVTSSPNWALEVTPRFARRSPGRGCTSRRCSRRRPAIGNARMRYRPQEERHRGERSNRSALEVEIGEVDVRDLVVLRLRERRHEIRVEQRLQVGHRQGLERNPLERRSLQHLLPSAVGQEHEVGQQHRVERERPNGKRPNGERPNGRRRVEERAGSGRPGSGRRGSGRRWIGAAVRGNARIGLAPSGGLEEGARLAHRSRDVRRGDRARSDGRGRRARRERQFDVERRGLEGAEVAPRRDVASARTGEAPLVDRQCRAEETVGADDLALGHIDVQTDAAAGGRDRLRRAAVVGERAECHRPG